MSVPVLFIDSPAYGQGLFHDSVYTLQHEFIMVAISLLVYECILTMNLEIKHIWLSKWTYTKVIYLLVRYVPLVAAAILVKQHTSLDATESFCKVVFPMSVWMMQVTIIFSEMILALRTWAIWNRHRIVGIGLAIVTITVIVAACVSSNNFLKGLHYGPSPYPGFQGCYMTGDVKLAMTAEYGIICCAQAVLLVLVAISALRSYRSGDRKGLSYIVHRDGIMFYVYLLCISIASLVMVARAPSDSLSSLAPMESVMYSVFVTRTILNIRSAAATGRSGLISTAELHSIAEQPQLPICFATVSSSNRHCQGSA